MVRWIAGLVALAVLGVTAFFVFHHPPMRLMPPPLIFRDLGPDGLAAAPALTDGVRIEVFYATNRLPVGPRDDRIYTVAPDARLHLGRATLRIGDEGSTLYQLLAWTTDDSDERPYIHLERMNETATLGADDVAAPPSEAMDWLAEIEAALEAARDGDVIVYVHGANTTVERAAGQASQLKHFTGRNAVVVLFAWPTAENFLRYSRDIRTAIGSAPKLVELLGLIADHTASERINVFTYSAGATVGGDALGLAARERPALAARIGEVYHAAPDADFRGFVDDLADYAGAASRVTAVVNLGDSALRLAGAVNRASRAGRPDLGELDAEAARWLLEASASDGLEIVQVSPESMPQLPASSHTFWYDDPWASNDMLMTLLFHLAPGARGLEAGVAATGQGYWTFPPDYPERARALHETLRPRLR